MINRDLVSFAPAKGENFDPSYLRINANGELRSYLHRVTSLNLTQSLCPSTATVPTLVVPLSTTLEPEVESRYRAIKDTKVGSSFAS